MNYNHQELIDFLDEELSLIADAIQAHDGSINGPVMRVLRGREEKLKEIRALVVFAAGPGDWGGEQ